MVQDKYMLCRFNDVFLSAKVFGQGKKKILAFHGYGQDADLYAPLVLHNDDFTIYSFDLFHHGKSAFPLNKLPLSHEELRGIMVDFFRQSAIDTFSLLGFSMGGKYALSVLSSFPGRVDQLLLVAPDGIKKDFWYLLATKFSLVRAIFHSVIKHPKLFNHLAMMLDRLNVVDGRVRKFAMNEMDTEEKRRRVYYSWVYHRQLFVDLPRLAGIINNGGIKLTFVLGKHDRIITSDYIKPLSKLVKDHHCIVLNCGHTTLLQKFIGRFKEEVKN